VLLFVSLLVSCESLLEGAIAQLVRWIQWKSTFICLPYIGLISVESKLTNRLSKICIWKVVWHFTYIHTYAKGPPSLFCQKIKQNSKLISLMIFFFLWSLSWTIFNQLFIHSFILAAKGCLTLYRFDYIWRNQEHSKSCSSFLAWCHRVSNRLNNRLKNTYQ